MTTVKNNYTLPIVMMFALFFMISFVTGLQNPFGIIVKDQFGTSNLMSQLGNAANFIAYAIMGFPAGLLLKRVGYKKTALVAIATGFFGVCVMFLSGMLENFSVYLAGALISGFSMCMLNTVVNPMLNTLGGGGNRGNQLIQFGGSINSIGATIIPVLVGYLIGNIANPTIREVKPALFIAMGIFLLAFLVLSAVRIPEPGIEKNVAKDKHDKYSALSFRHFNLGAIAIFIYVGIEVGIPNFVNLLLTSDVSEGGLDMDTTMAGAICGTYWFLMMIGRIVGASIAGKFSSRSMLTFVSVVGAVLTFAAIVVPDNIMVNMPVFKSDISFGFVEVHMSIMLLIMIGLCTSVMWGGIYNLAVEGLGKYTAMASGIFMIMVCGGGILPLIQGVVADFYGFLNVFWVVFVGMIFLLYYAIYGSKNVNNSIKVD